jgi:hypothetical protein
MTPENFCYWLQGYFELTGPGAMLSTRQLDVVRDHLRLVFDKQTPERSPFEALPLDRRIKCVVSC